MSLAPLPEPVMELRRNWFWFFLLGAVLMVLGMAAIGSSFVATLVVVELFAWLILVGGVLETLLSFTAHRWSGFLLHLLSGVLSIVLGGFILRHPLASAEGLTLLLAAVLLGSGAFRVAAAVSLRFPNWGWAALSGLVTAVLGMMILVEWPSSGLWVIGLFVGIDLVFRGISWATLALTVRRDVPAV
jgi:uncharacterized membrane protein HdeD (DUF308 family)